MLFEMSLKKMRKYLGSTPKADDPDKLYYRNIFLDAALLAGIVMNREDIDEKRVGVFGYSQGGALAVACSAL